MWLVVLRRVYLSMRVLVVFGRKLRSWWMINLWVSFKKTMSLFDNFARYAMDAGRLNFSNLYNSFLCHFRFCFTDVYLLPFAFFILDIVYFRDLLQIVWRVDSVIRGNRESLALWLWRFWLLNRLVNQKRNYEIYVLVIVATRFSVRAHFNIINNIKLAVLQLLIILKIKDYNFIGS